MTTEQKPSREEINARQRENYRLRMKNPEAKLAHRKNCREYVHARRERDAAFRQKTNAEAAAYRERQRAKILAEIAAGLRPAPVRMPKQTPEERRVYRQQWYQENKARIREKLGTPEGKDRCKASRKKRADKVKAHRSTPEFRAKDNARRREKRRLAARIGSVAPLP